MNGKGYWSLHFDFSTDFLELFSISCSIFDFGIMGPRVAPQQQQRNALRLHPFYEFPDDIPQEMLKSYMNMLGWLYNQEFAISPTTEWDKLNEIRILERLNPYLTKTFFENGASFTCNG
ncbi:unnamed protein product [Lactuca saligna]|uniref:Uncharacterized protein n=1 Tax=Lactuca saligna TaxID=75948 RepID=A0AA35ZE06_LACSI|nr:unnamed protein product [Lactuca saligna]